MNTTTSTQWVSPSSNIIAEANAVIKAKTRKLSPHQTILQVVKEASKKTGVPQRTLFSCPAIISEAAIVVENYYITGEYEDGEAAFWQMDKVIALAEEIGK